MTSLEEFRQLASRGNLIPVVAEIVGDVETPVGAFQKIGRDGWSFLFESAERNEPTVDVTQEELAATLALSRQTVSRAFRDLAREGAIKPERRRVRLLDLEKLREHVPH